MAEEEIQCACGAKTNIIENVGWVCTDAWWCPDCRWLA